MSFVTPQIKEALKNHVLEEALPFGHGFLAYYMKEPGQGRMMSTLLVFTPEGIVVMGDLCPEGAGSGGSISSFGYGVGWFSRQQGEEYLCSKFLRKEWQVEVAARWCRDHVADLKNEAKEECRAAENITEWEKLHDHLQDGCVGRDHFHEALQDLDYNVEDEGFDYPRVAAGWLCGLQQKFVELYAALKPAPTVS